MTYLAVRAALLAKPKKIRGWIFLAGLLVTLFMGAATIWKPVFFRLIEYKTYDTLVRSGGFSRAVTDSSNPVIVDIDEQSLARFGQWPWPRYRVGLLLRKIRDMGASGVGLDMVFAEQDRTSLTVIREEMRRQYGINLDLGRVPANLTDNDTVLADALALGPFVLGYSFLFEGKQPGEGGCTLHPVPLAVVGRGGKSGVPEGLFEAGGAACSLGMLSRSASASGFFNVIPDDDGVIRRVPLLIAYQGRVYPSLALATVMRSAGVGQLVIKTSPQGLEGIVFGNTVIPVDTKANLMVRFENSGRHFTRIPALDILLDRVPRTALAGKTVYVGSSAAGLEKLHATPLSAALPGAEIHAAVADNIMRRSFFSRPGWVPGLELALVLAFGIASALLLSWARSLLGLGFIVLSGLGIWFSCGWLLHGQGLFVSPLFPLMTLGANFSLLTFIKYQREERTVRTRNKELVVMQNFTIQCLAALTETRDSETGRHIERCQHYVKTLSNHLASNPRFSGILDEETVDLLYRSASLHDIGKVGVPDRILLKPGRLTIDEYQEMKKHTLYGREAIERAEHLYGSNVKDSFLKYGKVIAYTHHEKWDGSGYPEGIAGEDIPLFGRIMAIADVYDALICKRRYKPSFSHEESVEIITRNKGTHFDPTLVEAFLEVSEEFRNIARHLPDE